MKSITLTGQTTRYQMKKLLETSRNTLIPRTEYSTWISMHPELTCKDIWIESLGRIKENIVNINNPLDRIIKSELIHKLHGYRVQDKTKNVTVEQGDIMTLSGCIDLIMNNNFKCFYCLQECSIIYPHRRDVLQWTLDRIDNTLGHVETNVVLCCFGCNIQRRNKPSNKFRESKQFVFVKTGCKENADTTV